MRHQSYFFPLEPHHCVLVCLCTFNVASHLRWCCCSFGSFNRLYVSVNGFFGSSIFVWFISMPLSVCVFALLFSHFVQWLLMRFLLHHLTVCIQAKSSRSTIDFVKNIYMYLLYQPLLTDCQAHSHKYKHTCILNRLIAIYLWWLLSLSKDIHIIRIHTDMRSVRTKQLQQKMCKQNGSSENKLFYQSTYNFSPFSII